MCLICQCTFLIFSMDIFQPALTSQFFLSNSDVVVNTLICVGNTCHSSQRNHCRYPVQHLFTDTFEPSASPIHTIAGMVSITSRNSLSLRRMASSALSRLLAIAMVVQTQAMHRAVSRSPPPTLN